jgi:hypothetical protein
MLVRVPATPAHVHLWLTAKGAQKDFAIWAVGSTEICTYSRAILTSRSRLGQRILQGPARQLASAPTLVSVARHASHEAALIFAGGRVKLWVDHIRRSSQRGHHYYR